MTRTRLDILAIATGLVVLMSVFAYRSPGAPLVSQTKPTVPSDQLALKNLYEERCSACHNAYNPADPQYQRGKVQWQKTVDRMMYKHKASDTITLAEAAQIVTYLDRFVPVSTGKGRVSDPWATDSTDVWAETPTSSHVFNFVGSDALSGFVRVSAGSAGPAPLWSRIAAPGSGLGSVKAMLTNPIPTRFGILLDKGDRGTNVDVRVRFDIVAGKVSPAVGIVFGYVSPKNYYVLRYSALTKDISVIKVSEPVHTVIQKTMLDSGSIDAPSIQNVRPTPAATPITVGPGWHTLRLLVNNGAIRGWIDRNKRINTNDSSYAGGKLGLWNQGDTVASFSEFTVDVYDNATNVRPSDA